MEKTNEAVAAAEEAVAEAEAAEAAAGTTDEEPSAPESEPNVKKARGGNLELIDILWIVAIVCAVVAFVFVLLSQSALNGPGYYQFQAFGMKQPVKFEFLTTALAGWIALGLGVVSLGCGIWKNILKKRNRSTVNILPGIVMVVLSVICLLAAHFAK